MNGNKPAWKDAPEWAKYLAMDADGTWWWYESAPKTNIAYLKWWSYSAGKCEQAENQNELLWKTSLEERPA